MSAHTRAGPSWLLKGAVVLAAVSCSILAASVSAHHGTTRRSAQAGAGSHATLTLEQAIAQVQKRTSGKVLGADTQHRGHVIEYRIKVLTPNGHVRVVPVRTLADRATNNKENH